MFAISEKSRGNVLLSSLLVVSNVDLVFRTLPRCRDETITEMGSMAGARVGSLTITHVQCTCDASVFGVDRID